MTTRSLYVLDSMLTSWPGVCVYTYGGQGLPQPVSGFQPLNTLFNFYEVSVVEGGSWWLPTTLSSLAPAQWKSGCEGPVALSVTGTAIPTQAGGQSIVFPKSLLWWIPEDALGNNTQVVPASNDGTVCGQFPSLAPSGGGGQPRPPPPPPPQGPHFRLELTPTGARLVFKRTGLPSVLELDVEPTTALGEDHAG
jgi:hypothetical protein